MSHKVEVDEAALVQAYKSSRTAVADFAKKVGVSLSPLYRILRKHGIKIRSNSEAHLGIQALDNHPLWKGGRHFDVNGYRCVSLGKGKTKREHRVVMERHLGRSLKPTEVVHHINGDKADNRIENLELLPSQAEHVRRFHMTTERARSMAKKGNKIRWGRFALTVARAGRKP
jgi:hypothetical protein